MEVAAGWAGFFPLTPCLADIQPGAETQFADPKKPIFLPARGQTVPADEDMGAVQPPVGATIKVIAKTGGIGHIAIEPFEGEIVRCGWMFREPSAHDPCR